MLDPMATPQNDELIANVAGLPEDCCLEQPRNHAQFLATFAFLVLLSFQTNAKGKSEVLTSVSDKTTFSSHRNRNSFLTNMYEGKSFCFHEVFVIVLGGRLEFLCAFVALCVKKAFGFGLPAGNHGWTSVLRCDQVR